jgi:hypothetical protein
MVDRQMRISDLWSCIFLGLDSDAVHYRSAR